jgi:hypothetical protein
LKYRAGWSGHLSSIAPRKRGEGGGVQSCVTWTSKKNLLGRVPLTLAVTVAMPSETDGGSKVTVVPSPSVTGLRPPGRGKSLRSDRSEGQL